LDAVLHSEFRIADVNLSEMERRVASSNCAQPQTNQIYGSRPGKVCRHPVVDAEMHRMELDSILVTTRNRHDSGPAKSRLRPGRLFQCGRLSVGPIEDDARQNPFGLWNARRQRSARIRQFRRNCKHGNSRVAMAWSGGNPIRLPPHSDRLNRACKKRRASAARVSCGARFDLARRRREQVRGAEQPASVLYGVRGRVDERGDCDTGSCASVISRAGEGATEGLRRCAVAHGHQII
jgi:hypothetical protein